jgi:DNA-binding LytR/AlgR family response regulator
MIRVLIIEDNAEDEELLCSHLTRYAQEHGEKFQVSWHKVAFEIIENPPETDLIFLDIDLPGINGMETAEAFRARGIETPIIFVTNLAKYAVKGYQVDALDFIVKPVTFEDFALRMSKALRVINRNKGRVVYIPSKDGLTVIPVSKVIAIEVKGHYVFYHLDDEPRPFLCRKTLAKAQEELEGSSFVRISSSTLVNMDHVRKISGAELRLSNGETFTISRAKRHEALMAIADYYGGNA